MGNLRENRKGKTTILIAHRVSTVKDMDKVLYMDNGKVVGFGTHEQLEQTCPTISIWWSCKNWKRKRRGKMKEYLPLLIVGAILGVFSTVMIIAYATVKDKKSAIGFDRKMRTAIC